jgi:hypothetical protein
MCFVDKCTVKDHRNVELKAIVQRFSDPRFMGVSKMNVMMFDELKNHLSLEEEEEEEFAVQGSLLYLTPLSPGTISVENLSLSEVESEKENVGYSQLDLVESESDQTREYTPLAPMDCGLSNPTPNGLPYRPQPSLKENIGTNKATTRSSPHLRAPLQSIGNHLEGNLQGKKARPGHNF